MLEVSGVDCRVLLVIAESLQKLVEIFLIIIPEVLGRLKRERIIDYVLYLFPIIRCLGRVMPGISRKAE